VARLALTIADTDVLIDYLRGRNPAADRVAAELDRDSLYTTVITRFELMAGARTDPLIRGRLSRPIRACDTRNL